MLFKRKQTAPPADESQAHPLAGTGDWEQTLVAAEAPPAEAAPALEPLPEPAAAPPEATSGTDTLELLEPLPEPPTEPAPQPELEPLLAEPEPDVAPAESDALAHIPRELRRYVRLDGSALVLREPYLDAKTRTALEKAASRGGGVRLDERRWIPAHRLSAREVEGSVDGLAWGPRYKPKAVAWSKPKTARRAARRGLQRIPANILDKRVVYETEGGFVVEVIYSERGRRRVKYFTVPAKGSRLRVLEAIQSGSYAQATVVNPELVDDLPPRGKRARGHLEPGKILTWPIQNRHPTWDLDGISKQRAATLEGIGIRSTDQLRVRPAAVIARHLGVSEATAERWRSQAELLLVSGVGAAYAGALAEAGVDLEGLRAKNPRPLAALVNETIDAMPPRKRPPHVGAARAATWVRNARKLRLTQQAFPE